MTSSRDVLSIIEDAVSAKLTLNPSPKDREPMYQEHLHGQAWIGFLLIWNMGILTVCGRPFACRPHLYVLPCDVKRFLSAYASYVLVIKYAI